MTSPAAAPAPVPVLVFLDPAFDGGRLADATKPQLMATDQGATRGDGIFETMLAVGGNVRKVQAHLDRLARSADALDLVIPPEDEWRRAIGTALSEHRSEYPPASAAEDEPGNGAVRNKHALGRAGGAAGVKDVGHGVRRDADLLDRRGIEGLR